MEIVNKRRFNPSKTVGGTDWKQILVDNVNQTIEPDHGDGRVYDWRFNIPHLMYGIALRLKQIALIDPNWRTNRDHDDELLKYADTLAKNYIEIVEGVRCGFTAFRVLINSFLNIACADIHTGVSVDIETEALSSSELQDRLRDVPAIQEQLVHQVVLQIPLFELRTMLDFLNSYLVHRPDLTADLRRIPLNNIQNLCLDLRGGDIASFTPAFLMPCSGKATQMWVYDRANGQIRNLGANRCLDVTSGSPMSDTSVQIADCVEMTDPKTGEVIVATSGQKWTYDPIFNTLQSALGTILSPVTSLGRVIPNTPIRMAWPVRCPANEPRCQEPYVVAISNVDSATGQQWQAARTFAFTDQQRWHADMPINDLVLFFPANFETIRNTEQCPAGFVGKFQFDGDLIANAGSNQDFSDIVLKVNTLTNGNLLLDTDQGPGGVGATVTYPSEPKLLYGHSIPNRFVLCLRTLDRFEFTVDVYGGRMPDSRCAASVEVCP
jgi:hypothetical protein